MQEETQTATPEITLPTAKQNTLVKDLMIPVSIVLAGIFIGAGLYFGGTPTSNVANQPVAVEEKEVDNTGKINPITTDEHIKGNPDAPIKIVEYSDYDCPFCSRYHDVMNAVIEKNGNDVAWVFRQFPLEQLHPNAPAVALASECVALLGGNDAYWKFTDDYFAARGAGDKTAHNELIPKLVIAAGVQPTTFAKCFDNAETAAAVKQDMDDAIETGGRGTPWSILIGPSGKTYPINGALPQQSIEQLIEIAKKEA